MSKRLNLALLALILCISVLAMTLATTDSMKVGSGFGRESKFIINTQNSELLEKYLNNLDRRGIETHIVEITDYEFEVTFSALENVDIIKSEISKVIPDVTFKYEGSFGNIGTYINNQGFVSTYLVLLIFSLFIYFTMRYRFWGFVTGLQISVSFAFALLAINALNLPFTEMLWYAIIVSLLIVIQSKHSFIKDNHNVDPLTFSSMGYNIIKRPIHIGLLNIVFGFVMLLSNLIEGESTGLFIIVFSIAMLALDFFIALKFESIVEAFIEGDDDGLKFVDTWSLPSQLNHLELFKRISIIGLIILCGVVIFMPKSIIGGFESSDYDSQKVVIVSDSDARSYLEVEAKLNSIGLFDKQLSYSTSDQNELWIYFNRDVSESDLKIARNLISHSLGIKVSSYITRDTVLPTQYFEFYLTLVLCFVIAGLAVLLLFENRSFMNVLLMSAIGILMFIVVINMFAPNLKEEYVFMTYCIPLFFANYYSTKYNQETLINTDMMKREFPTELSTLAVLVLILSALILIIVPIQIGSDLIENLVLFALSLELTRLTYVYFINFIRKYVKKNDDESYSEL